MSRNIVRAGLLIVAGILLGWLAWKKFRPTAANQGPVVAQAAASAAKVSPKAPGNLQKTKVRRSVLPSSPQQPARPAMLGNTVARTDLNGFLWQAGLPVEQREKLIDLYVFCLEMKSDLRAKNVTSVKKISGDTIEVKIGAYPELGSALRDRFYTGAKDILGDEYYAKTMSAELRGMVEGAFGSFGHMEEVLTIRKLSAAEMAENRLTYYMFQSLQAAGDEKSLQYLSDVDPAKGTGYTSTRWFNREDIADGQFSFLLPILDANK